MKRTQSLKFPHSAQLFKFCQKVLSHQKDSRVRDQEIGNILNYNPSDCSHWKRGEKNVRSVFALAKLGESLAIETSLIHDTAIGALCLEEAYFEYLESLATSEVLKSLVTAEQKTVQLIRNRVHNFVAYLHEQAEFFTPPLYLPEVFRAFPFISTQSADMVDKLSRILKVKQGQFCIQYKKGDLKAQTRLSMVKDLARIIFEAERAKYPQLGEPIPGLLAFEQMLFSAQLLIPSELLKDELAKLDARKNVVHDLGGLFWVPKTLVSFQLQNMFLPGEQTVMAATANNQTNRSPARNLNNEAPL